MTDFPNPEALDVVVFTFDIRSCLKCGQEEIHQIGYTSICGEFVKVVICKGCGDLKGMFPFDPN
jgi:hypothetical protein